MLFDVLFVEFEHLVHMSNRLCVLGLEVDEHHADPLATLDRFFHDQMEQNARILAAGERQIDPLDAIERLRNPAPCGSEYVSIPVSFDRHQ